MTSYRGPCCDGPAQLAIRTELLGAAVAVDPHYYLSAGSVAPVWVMSTLPRASCSSIVLLSLPLPHQFTGNCLFPATLRYRDIDPPDEIAEHRPALVQAGQRRFSGGPCAAARAVPHSDQPGSDPVWRADRQQRQHRLCAVAFALVVAAVRRTRGASRFQRGPSGLLVEAEEHGADA